MLEHPNQKEIFARNNDPSFRKWENATYTRFMKLQNRDPINWSVTRLLNGEGGF